MPVSFSAREFPDWRSPEGPGHRRRRVRGHGVRGAARVVPAPLDGGPAMARGRRGGGFPRCHGRPPGRARARAGRPRPPISSVTTSRRRASWPRPRPRAGRPASCSRAPSRFIGEETGRGALRARFAASARRTPMRARNGARRRPFAGSPRAPGLPVAIVRIPLTYGPGVGGNFRALLRLADTGTWLPFAAIANRRSLVHVSDLADALLLAAGHPDAPGRAFIAAHPVPVSTPRAGRGDSPRARPARPPVPRSAPRPRGDRGRRGPGRAHAAADALARGRSRDPRARRSGGRHASRWPQGLEDTVEAWREGDSR